MMQEEFNVELRPHLYSTLPAPVIKHDTEMDETLNNNKQKATVVNVQTGHLVIGYNNVINSILDPNVKQEIKELMDGHQRVLLENIKQMCVVTYFKQVTETGDKTFLTDRHNNGMDTGQGARSSSCKTKEHKDYFVEWKIKTSDDTDKEELEKIAKYIEQERVIDENVTIKFVRVGSIVIGTLISANVVENSDIFIQTVRRFIRMIINKCNFNTTFEHVVEVDVTLKPSSECTKLSINKVRYEIPTPSTKVMKSHEISTQTNDSEIQLVKTESAYVKMFSNPSAVKESMMSLKVDSFGNRTFYEKVDETEILYAEFPFVKIKAITNYTHTVDKQQVAMMKKDQIYFLIKQVGDWWEITDNPGPLFFVKSEYAVITTPGNVLSPVRKLSTRHALSSTAVQKHHAGAFELLGGADSKIPESDYDTIPGDNMDVKATLRKTISGEQVRHHEHEPLRKAISEALPQHSQKLKRKTAVYYAENQDSSDIALTPSQKIKAFREKRAMSIPSLDTHSDPCPEEEATTENFNSL